ncbi:uncharacterized protein BKA78DRAFT_91574 [Phyllosticta capitalensis]|uniref:uncharacterized protein n=1 Tax=Phyllosticta capitalensis TaxID=121624 RepID=UPI003131BB1D
MIQSSSTERRRFISTLKAWAQGFPPLSLPAAGHRRWHKKSTCQQSKRTTTTSAVKSHSGTASQASPSSSKPVDLAHGLAPCGPMPPCFHHCSKTEIHAGGKNLTKSCTQQQTLSDLHVKTQSDASPGERFGARSGFGRRRRGVGFLVYESQGKERKDRAPQRAWMTLTDS